MSDSHTMAMPEVTNATSTDHPPVRVNQSAMLRGRGSVNEAEVEQGAIAGQQVMRAIGGGSPAAPPEQFAGALGRLSGAAQVGMMRQLQRSYGNSYVGRVIQAKLTVGQPGDVYEQEADRVAEQVMRMPDRTSSNHELSFSSLHTATAQRQCTVCEEEEKLQRKESGSTAETPATVPPVVHEVLRSPGQPLDPGTRAFMELRFGHDFSHVRVHTDARAAESSRTVNAMAYTVGNNVVFGAHQYAPKTQRGRELLAHELTHTIQQQSASGAPPSTDPHGIYESSAEAAGRTVASGGTVPSNLPTCGIGLSRVPASPDVFDQNERARQLQEVTKRLKQPEYPGRDRDLAMKEALLFLSDMKEKEDEDEPVAMHSMDISKEGLAKAIVKPAAKSSVRRNETPLMGLTDKELDGMLEELQDDEYKTYKQEEEEKERKRKIGEQDADETRHDRFMGLRKLLEEHGARRGVLADNLIKWYSMRDLQILRHHGLEWSGRGPTQSNLKEAIDRYDYEWRKARGLDGPSMKAWTQADREALEKKENMDRQYQAVSSKIQGVADSGFFATLGRLGGYIAAKIRRLDDDEALELSEITATISGFGDSGLLVTAGMKAKASLQSYNGGGGLVAPRDAQVTQTFTRPSAADRVKDGPWAGSVSRPVDVSGGRAYPPGSGPTAPTVSDVTPKSPVTSQTSEIPTMPRFTDVTKHSAFDSEYADFLALLRQEGATEFSAAGEPFTMQPYGGARQARQTIGVSGSTHQAMHGLPRSVGRGIPGYNPRAALTMIEQTGIHTGMDAYWKQAFQAMRRSGDTDATAQKIYDTLADSIQLAPDLSQGIKNSLKARLHDEMFVEYGLASGDVMPLPYPNIPPASTPSP